MLSDCLLFFSSLFPSFLYRIDSFVLSHLLLICNGWENQCWLLLLTLNMFLRLNALTWLSLELPHTVFVPCSVHILLSLSYSELGWNWNENSFPCTFPCPFFFGFFSHPSHSQSIFYCKKSLLKSRLRTCQLTYFTVSCVFGFYLFCPSCLYIYWLWTHFCA